MSLGGASAGDVVVGSVQTPVESGVHGGISVAVMSVLGLTTWFGVVTSGLCEFAVRTIAPEPEHEPPRVLVIMEPE